MESQKKILNPREDRKRKDKGIKSDGTYRKQQQQKNPIALNSTL